MGRGNLGVGGHGRLIEPLRLEQQAVIQILMSLGGKHLRALQRRKRGQARGAHLVHHEGGLVEGGGVKAALDALQRIGFAPGFLV